MIHLALFGHPVRHSLSPRIHAEFARQTGLELRYEALDASADFLSREVQKLADAGGLGCNITSPLKQRAFQLANRSSERAERAGAANTLHFKSPSSWSADNTDGIGLVRDLRDNLGLQLAGKRLCVLGAGGAGAGVIHDLLQCAPAELVLFNRTLARAETLLARALDEEQRNQTRAAGLDELGKHGTFDLVIHATSAGHHGGEPVLDERLLGPQSVCYDLNYGPSHKRLANWCTAHDVLCHDGLGMLVEQAAESFLIWTGEQANTTGIADSLRITS